MTHSSTSQHSNTNCNHNSFKFNQNIAISNKKIIIVLVQIIIVIQYINIIRLNLQYTLKYTSQSSTRTPAQTHRQLIASQNTKFSTPRSFDIKSTNIFNNGAHSGSAQKFIQTPSSKTVGSGGFLQNGALNQMTQHINNRPFSGAGGASQIRVNSQEGEQSSELAYLNSYQAPSISKKQQIMQQHQYNSQQGQMQQQQIPNTVFSPQKYLVQNQRYFSNQHTELQEQPSSYQNQQWQSNQQQASQNPSSSSTGLNLEQLKMQLGQQKLQLQLQTGFHGNTSQSNSQINQQQQMMLHPQQNVTKILKLLDYLIHKNLFDDAIDVCWEYAFNTINNHQSNTTIVNAFSEHFYERNKLFQYVSHFYSYLSNGETVPQPFQGGFASLSNQNQNVSSSQSQFPIFGSGTSTIYQGNLNYGNPSINLAGTMNINNNNVTNNSENNSSHNLQQFTNTTTQNQNIKNNRRKTDTHTMLDTFQICMEKILEENEIYKQQYGIKYPQAKTIVFGQKMVYLNNIAVYNMKKHNYVLAFEQFGVIEKYSRYSSSSQQRNEHIKQLSIIPSILNNVALSSILLEDWNSAESLLSKSIEQQEAKVFPNMKNIEKRYLQEDQQFLSELPVLIFGYIYAELVKRVKIQLKIPLSQFSVATDAFFIKNAVNISRKYFGQDHSFTRKIISIQKFLDSNVINSQTNGQTMPFSTQGTDEPDLFDSQPLGSSLPGISNISTTNNNLVGNMQSGLGLSSTNTLPCIFLILKECQFEMNHIAINYYKQYIKFRRENFDKELSLWKQTMDFPNQLYNHHSFNQSSTRISTEPSSQLHLKKNFNQFQNSSPSYIHSYLDQPVQSDRISVNTGTGSKKEQERGSNYSENTKRSSSHSLQNQNPNNGQNTYFLQNNHNGSSNSQQRQGSQSQRQQSASRQKNPNTSGFNSQQNNPQNSSNSQQYNRQYYQTQGDKQNNMQNDDTSLNRNQSQNRNQNLKNQPKLNNYPTNESFEDANDQSEGYYESEDQEQEEDETYHKGEENGYSKAKQKKQSQQRKNSNSNQDDSNTNSKRISTKRVQSEYYTKKPSLHQEENVQQQQDSAQIAQEKGIDDNLKNMIMQVMNQTEQIKKEKQNSVLEISQLKTMLNSLMEQQKSSTTQLQQQQQSFIENQIKQLQQLEKKKQEQQINNNQQNIAQSPNDNDQFKFSSQSPNQSQMPIMQLLNILQDTPYESFSLSKQIYCGGNVPYVITSTLYQSGSLEIKAESQNQVIATEKLEKDQLKLLLESLNYQPTIPSTFSLNMCQNIYLFNKYFILPFTSIDPTQKELKFLTNAPGLLSKVYEKTFMGEKVLQFFHHVEGNTFRIVLGRKEKGNVFRIDIDMDSGSQKKWVEWINENEYSKDEINNLVELTKESQFQKHEQLKEMQQRNLNLENVKKFTPKNSCQFKMRSYKIINEVNLVKELDDIIEQIQELLYSHLIKDVSLLLECPHFIRVKIWSITQKRQIQLCIDSPDFIPQFKSSAGQISKSTDYGEIKVLLKNIYFTFGPGGEKLKAQGVSSYSYNQVQSMYNFKFQNLHLSEKVCILSHLPDYFALNVHEKNDESLQQAKSTKQTENPIVRNQHMSGAFTRILHKYTYNNNSNKSEFLYPITFEIIGANSKMIGVRVSIYNLHTCKENGFFLAAEDQHWAFENKILVKNSHHMYLEGLPLSQYYLPHIFEEVVVPLILKNISIYEDQTKNNELSVRFNKGLITQNSTTIYRIENIISVNEIVKNCQYIISKNPQ